MDWPELTRQRLKLSQALAAAITLAIMLFATAGDVRLLEAPTGANRAVNVIEPCCWKIVAAAPIKPVRGMHLADGDLAASRSHIRPRFLPAGVAPERGLQVRTILTARNISAAFPQIKTIGGVRPDPLPWHPLGLALDVMIPNPGSAQGIALGNAIVEFVMRNATRYGIRDAIWRGVYYTPNGGRSTAGDHFDHVHVTTTGGGYPRGGEMYPDETSGDG